MEIQDLEKGTKMASIRNRPSTGKATLWTLLNILAFRYYQGVKAQGVVVNAPCICMFSTLHTFDLLVKDVFFMDAILVPFSTLTNPVWAQVVLTFLTCIYLLGVT